jgi:hypothetical protein
MNSLRHAVFLLLAGLTGAGLLEAKTDPSVDVGSIEARWRDYADVAQDTQPAMEFPYAACFQRAARTHELPETLLLAVARGESNFEPGARSKANAIGLMQILWPVTANHLGLEQLSEVLDPCTNVDAGARYLKELLARYDGDLHRTLAAYNYGPARIPVRAGQLPDGAVWYSGYIMRHLDFVMNGRAGQKGGDTPRRYVVEDRLFVIQFSRPYRAAAFVDNLQPEFGALRLDWFQRPDGRFDVVLLFANAQERDRGKALLKRLGFG